MRRIPFKFHHFGEVLDADLLIATAEEWQESEESTQERWSVSHDEDSVFALRLPHLPNMTGRPSSETARSAPLGADSHVDRDRPNS